MSLDKKAKKKKKHSKVRAIRDEEEDVLDNPHS